MYKLVIDLEMCDRMKAGYDFNMHEIIQIGAVLLGHDNEELRRFSELVKPRYSTVTTFIANMTDITEHMLEDASDIRVVFDKLIDFVGVDNLSFTYLVTWSDNDTKVMSKELRIKQIKNSGIQSLLSKHIDVQKEFDNQLHSPHCVGLKAATDILDCNFEGEEHNALYDAVNTGNIYRELHAEVKCKALNVIDEAFKEKPCTTSLGGLFSSLQLNF